MGSSPEMEMFGVSDADYEYMMNPLKRQHTQSKKERIYGIFASDDSEPETERSGLGGRSGRLKNRKTINYAEPISFVSGGIKLGSKTEEDSVNDQISDEESEKQILKSLHVYGDSDSESSDDIKLTHKPSKHTNYGAFRGRRNVGSSSATKSSSGGFGAWERHTKGIGMKLLEQMGYEHGKGLGPVGQGITTPVEAVQRVGKVAVGFYGSEKVVAPRKGNEVVVEDNKEDSSGPRYKKSSQSRSKNIRPTYEYKTADELVSNLCPTSPIVSSKKHGLFLENSEMSKVKVIDMTSKEQKVYSGYNEALSRLALSGYKPKDGLEEDGFDNESKRLEKRRQGLMFDCPALRHNFLLVMRNSEDEIRKLDRNAKFGEDRVIGLEHDIENLTEVVKSESIEVGHLEKALNLIDRCEREINKLQNEHSHSNISESIALWMSRIREECYDLPEMPLLLAAIARPVLDSYLKKWNPLSEPAFCVNLMSKWRDYFQNSSAFDVILETSWLSTLRRTIVSDWDPKNGDQLFDVLEAWKFLLPEEMLQNRILDQLILPKLQDAVSSWNPLTDTIPIHTWLHPWLPWFGGVERLSSMNDTILQKLGNCLVTWHPSDASAHSILLPWRSILPIGVMSAFLNRYIVPKLGVTLQQFQLNPSNQNMDPWKWVMRWTDLLDPTVIVNMLDQHFWVKWLSVLSNWLCQGVDAKRRGDADTANRIFQEVGRWYSGWKGQLPPECLEFAGVKNSLTKALSIMERAMKGLMPQEPKTVPNCSATNFSIPNPQVPNFIPPVPVALPTTASLRQQVEQLASSRGLLFHPIFNRVVEGQQIYKLENLQVFFDRNVSFVHNPVDGAWHPISLSELVSRAQY